MRNGNKKLAELERRVDQRFALVDKQFDGMRRQFKSLRGDLRVLFRFVNILDKEFRQHRADDARHARR